MDTTKLDKLIKEVMDKLEYNEPTISMDYLEECLGVTLTGNIKPTKFKMTITSLQKLIVRGYRLETSYNDLLDIIKNKNPDQYLELLNKQQTGSYPLLKLHSECPSDLDGDTFMSLFTYIYANRDGKVGLHKVIDKGRVASNSSYDEQMNKLARSLKI